MVSFAWKYGRESLVGKRLEMLGPIFHPSWTTLVSDVLLPQIE